jgi:hypothetical protein
MVALRTLDESEPILASGCAARPTPEDPMLNLYCDESHDGTTYALAGWVATPSAWEDIDSRWREMLSKHGAAAFHTAELVERENIKGSRFKGWTFDQETAIFQDAIDILVVNKHWITSVGCSVCIPTAKPWADSKDGAIWNLLFVSLFHLLLDRFNAQNGISLMFDEKPEVRDVVNRYYFEAKAIVDAVRPGMLADATVAFGAMTVCPRSKLPTCSHMNGGSALPIECCARTKLSVVRMHGCVSVPPS